MDRARGAILLRSGSLRLAAIARASKMNSASKCGLKPGRAPGQPFDFAGPQADFLTAGDARWSSPYSDLCWLLPTLRLRKLLSKPKLVCREAEGHLGTRVRTARRCLTAEEWQQEDAERERVPVTLRVTAGQGDTPTRPSQTPQ